MSSWDDDGLPDAAFTEDELAAGVQHIVRTGDPDATSSGRRPIPWDDPAHDMEDDQRTHDAYDVLSSRAAAHLRFETFAQARAWSQANPGKMFTRAADGCGFEAKPVLPVVRAQGVNSVQQGINDDGDPYGQRMREIGALAPHLHYVLSHCPINRYRVILRPFDRRIWEGELSRLTTVQLSRLRLLLVVHLGDFREHLRGVYAEMRRFPSMKAGDYCEEETELLSEFTEKALKDIDKRLPSRSSDDGGWHIPF